MTPNEKPRGQSLLIIGAGVMGQGIARLFAGAGMTVTLVDPRDVNFSHPRVTLVRHAPPDIAASIQTRLSSGMRLRPTRSKERLPGRRPSAAR